MNELAHSSTGGEIFTHIRVIVGMVLGLSVSRLITGMTRFIQHPGREQLSLSHFCWVLFLLLFIIHFWWFEFSFSHRQNWSFELYVFLIFYAGLFAALSAVLFPDRIDEYQGFGDYFRKRRHAFYILLLLLLTVDVIDTLIKGREYYVAHYGSWYYPVRQAVLFAGTALALIWRSKRYQEAFAVLALLFHIFWIISRFEVLR